MATIIKNRKLTTDPWQTLSAEASAANAPRAPLLAPFARWQQEREALLALDAPLGVCLQTNDDPALLAADLARLQLIAIRFAKFTDGRGYSSARLLRERYGYTGELRAVGEVLRDQLQDLERCGFDAFALRADQDAEAALGAFTDFSDAYQTHVTQPQPLFRRRAGAAT